MLLPEDDVTLVDAQMLDTMRARKLSKRMVFQIVEAIVRNVKQLKHQAFTIWEHGTEWHITFPHIEEVEPETKQLMAKFGYPMVVWTQQDNDGQGFISRSYHGFIVKDRISYGGIGEFLSTTSGIRIFCMGMVVIGLFLTVKILEMFRGRL